MSSALPESDWLKSPAHRYFLSAFLVPQKAADVLALVDWESALGEEPQKAIDRFVASGVLVNVGLEHLRRFTVAKLKELLRESGLKMSGRKDQLIQRLIDADPDSLGEAVPELTVYRCSERGAEIAEQHLIGEANSLTQLDSLPLDSVGRVIDFILLAAAAGVIGDAAHDALKELPRVIKSASDAQAAQPIQPDSYEYYREGNLSIEEGDYGKALRNFGQAIELDLNYAQAYYGRGVTYEKMGDYKKAFNDYSKAIELEPNYARAYFSRGFIHRRMGDNENALSDCSKAIELDPNYAQAYHNRGSLYGSMGEYEKALHDYSKAIELDPDYILAYYSRGVIYKRMGDQRRAEVDFRSGAKLQATDAKGYLSRGGCHEHLGQYDQAMADYEKCLSLKPGRYTSEIAKERLEELQHTSWFWHGRE